MEHVEETYEQMLERVELREELAMRLGEQREREAESQRAQKQLIHTLGRIYKHRANRRLVDESYRDIYLMSRELRGGDTTFLENCVYLTPGFVFSRITSESDIAHVRKSMLRFKPSGLFARILLRDLASAPVLYDNYGRSSVWVDVPREMESFLFDFDRVDTGAGTREEGYFNWHFSIDKQHDDAFPRRPPAASQPPQVKIEIQLAALARCIQRTSTCLLSEVGDERGEIRLFAPPNMPGLFALIDHLYSLRFTDKRVNVDFDFDFTSAAAANSIHAHLHELENAWERTHPQQDHTENGTRGEVQSHWAIWTAEHARPGVINPMMQRSRNLSVTTRYTGGPNTADRRGHINLTLKFILGAQNAALGHPIQTRDTTGGPQWPGT